MSTKGWVIIVVGPSGSGKSSLCHHLEKDKFGKFSISVTTRKPAPTEIDGKDYFFVDNDEFERMLHDQELLEWAMVHDKYYGTPKNWIEQQLNNDSNVLLEIDIAGAKQVRAQLDNVTTIFILPPSFDELKRRLVARRRDSEEQIKTRLMNACQEILHINDFDFLLINEHFDKVYEQAKTVVKSCRDASVTKELLNELQVSSQTDLISDWYKHC